MNTSDFDYPLPPELIAQTPAEPRDQSRLLVLRRSDGSLEHHRFSDIVDFIRASDVLVLNDTRVIPARLQGQKGSGGRVEILLLRRLEPGLWEALVRPSQRIAVGERVEVGTAYVDVLERKEEGVRIVRFADEALVESLGQVPLPPYIHHYRGDRERYQTVYSREKGSVAAPTAGLHFTPRLLDRIREKGVDLVFVTLHVGLDTFRPIREEDPRQHRIHQEFGVLSPEAAGRLARARAEGRRIICVGTTAVRLVEQAALKSERPGEVHPFQGWVDLFILPGHRFRLVDAMITNFHLPRSTLLMLVSAFAGQELVRQAYAEAVRERYRFYSFGDAMLVL
jgi:S-adenosylmethionine:tRNA ribosyltransferase-isomerase